VIPKTEKKEIKTEIKQEPGIQIKQELDIRSSSISGRWIKGIQIKQELDIRSTSISGRWIQGKQIKQELDVCSFSTWIQETRVW